jgi:hypothetical protein
MLKYYYRSYKVINKVLYVTTLMTPPTMKIVTKTSNTMTSRRDVA